MRNKHKAPAALLALLSALCLSGALFGEEADRTGALCAQALRDDCGESPLGGGEAADGSAAPPFAENGCPPGYVPLPEGLKRPLSRRREELLKPFLGIPYRVDGAVSDSGEWTLWAQSERIFKSPGLNCSGFLLEASRFLLGRNFSMAYAKKDFFGDSGPDSPFGEDWDFGLDVALNLAGWDAELVPPAAGPTLSENSYGRKQGLGADIHSPEFPALLDALKPGSLYFFAISKPDRRFPGGLSYYHNGLAAPDGPSVWLYHATRRAGVHRLDLKTPRSLGTFRASFPPVKNHGERRILFAEAKPLACHSPGRSGGHSLPSLKRSFLF